ncbi:DUF6798 domain-containing protein [Candidatus Omnitrophota bacterium]
MSFSEKNRYLLFLVPLLGLIICVICNGYEFNVRDQTVFLPYLQHTVAGVPFSGHDMLIGSIRGVSTMHVFLAPVFALLPNFLKTGAATEWMIFVLYLTSLYAVFISVFYIARRVTGSEGAAFLACLALVAAVPRVQTVHAITENYLSSRTIALALTVSALAAGVAGRPLAACGLAGLAMNVNPTMALPVIAALIFYLLATPREGERPYRLPVLGIGIMILLSVPWIISVASRDLQIHPINPSQAWSDVMRIRFGYHDVRQWDAESWLSLAAPLAILAAASGYIQHTAARTGGFLRALFWTGLAMAAIQITTLFIGQFPIVLASHFIRAYTYIYLLSCIALALIFSVEEKRSAVRTAIALLILFCYLLGMHQFSIILSCVLIAAQRGMLRRFRVPAAAAALRKKPPPGLTRAAAFLCAAALIAVPGESWRAASRKYPDLTFGNFCKVRYQLPGLRNRSPFELAAVWARQNTPQDAVFYVPIDSRGFRGFSHRSPMFLIKDGCFAIFDEGYAQRWLKEFVRWKGGVSIIPGPSQAGSDGERPDTAALVSYLMLPGGSVPENMKPYSLYSNAGWYIFRLSDLNASIAPAK